MTNEKTKEALRMVGHLLETNGTTGSFATNKYGEPTYSADPNACRWCLVGATWAVEDVLSMGKSPLLFRVQDFLGFDMMVEAWDTGSDQDRQDIIERLKSA